MFGLFKRKRAMLIGTVEVTGLPQHKLCSVSLAFFPVHSATADPPFAGNPSADQYTDVATIREAESPLVDQVGFQLSRPSGYYYVAVSVIAFYERDDQLIAQVERFFPMPAPCHVHGEFQQTLALSVAWPNIPFSELQHFGTIRPNEQVAGDA